MGLFSSGLYCIKNLLYKNFFKKNKKIFKNLSHLRVFFRIYR